VPDATFYSNALINPGDRIYLERPQLNHILEQAVTYPLVYVIAGAGFGKSHGVYSFLRKNNFITTWMQFSERDNIAGRFWENFTAAIAMISPDDAIRLRETGFPETDRQFERYMKIPRAGIEPKRKYVFVYDDVHLLRDKKVLRFLGNSVTSPFPNITSILISRNEPAINAEKLSKTGRLARITEEDLRFTQEETAGFFALHQIYPSTQTLSSILNDTDGWAFALYLAALSLKNAGAEYALQGMKSNIFKLIESEIISVLPEQERKYLIKLSLIDHLAPDLLASFGRALPASLGSFIQFDTYLNAYKLHPLIRDFLSKKKEELSREEQREVCLKAADWCMKNNRPLDAIGYFEKAGDYNKLFNAAYSMFSFIIPNHIAQVLLAIYEKAPRDVFENNPVMYNLYTRLLINLELFDRAAVELREIITKLETLEPSPIKNRALGGSYMNLALCGFYTSLLTGDYSFSGLYERASYYYHKLDTFTIKPPLSVATVCSYVCRVSSSTKGEIERFIATLDETVPYAASCLGGCTWGMNDLARTEAAFFRGRFAEAEQHAETCIRKARQQYQAEIENRALFFLLRINLARGDYQGIRGLLRQLDAQLAVPEYLNRNIYHDIETGWFYIQIGQEEKIAPWLKNDFEESDLNFMIHGFETLVKARHHLAEQRYPAALATLDRDDKFGPGAFLFGKLEIKALEAVCYYQFRDYEKAFAALKTAYELAQPNEISMPFIELGKYMRTLVSRILKEPQTGIPQEWLEMIRRGAAAYARKLFIIAENFRPRASSPARSRSTGVEAWKGEQSLSRRELAVLTGLSQGLTRTEIAENLLISVNTVKSVIRSVYNKLGAINQADAVRIAGALGIIE
jgi:LuxR family maltose regulon positive regulatory protein